MIKSNQATSDPDKYSIFFSDSLFTCAVAICFIKQLEFVNQLKIISPESFCRINPFVVAVVAGTFTLFTLASLHFMWSVRHPNTE